MYLFINVPEYKSEKVESPYAQERDCAHVLLDSPELKKWVLVHALVKGKSTAWLEYAGKVMTVKMNGYQDVRLKTSSKLSFYKKHKPAAIQYFTLKDVKLNMKKFRRWGAWE